MSDLTHVPLGANRFRAQVITEACRAAGLKVQLLTSDSWYGEIPEYRLLVHSGDLDQVLAVVHESESDADSDQP